MTEVEVTTEQLIGEYLTVMHRTLGSMFNIPLNMTIYDFADKWVKLPANIKFSKTLNVLDDPSAIHHVARMSITPITSVLFDSDDMAESGSPYEDEQSLDSIFYFDTPYTYGELLTGLMLANYKLHKLSKIKEFADERIVPMCVSMADAFNFLRPDVASKMMTADGATAISTAALILQSVVEEIVGIPDEDSEEDEDEE